MLLVLRFSFLLLAIMTDTFSEDVRPKHTSRIQNYIRRSTQRSVTTFLINSIVPVSIFWLLKNADWIKCYCGVKVHDVYLRILCTNLATSCESKYLKIKIYIKKSVVV